MTAVTPADAVDVLNRIHAADPLVLDQLVSARVSCNQALADDPTVQVGGFNAEGEPVRSDGPAVAYQVGLLGILNGIFGVQENGQGYIAAVFANGFHIDRFVVNL